MILARIILCAFTVNFIVLCSWQITRGNTTYATLDFVLAIIFLYGAIDYARSSKT